MTVSRDSKPSFLIAALGLAQIVSWGSLYYSFSLFVLPMQQSLGWSLTSMNGALTVGLLVAGLCAYPIGALIDRHGGRLIMTVGSIAAALLLVAWSAVETLTGFYAVWIGIGMCMAAVLYEPIFIVLTYHFGADARHAITRLTLVAGFASTVFMPLIELLLVNLPWRSVLVILASILAVITIPLHALYVPACPPQRAKDPTNNGKQSLLGQRLRDPVFWGLTLWFTAYAGTASGLMFQLVPYLKSIGSATATILITVALVGPMQVVGRLLIMLLGPRASTTVVGAVITSVTPVAVLILIFAPPTLFWLAMFASAFGMANGISTILRGATPAEWLGRDDYGRTMGAMGAPMLIVAALAPLVTAALWSGSGDPAVMHWAVFALACAGAAGFWFAALMHPARVT